jgi:hypothetical protein
MRKGGFSRNPPTSLSPDRIFERRWAMTVLNNQGFAMTLRRRHLPARGESERRGMEWRYLWQQCRSRELVRTNS